jgi:hypothetical protein
MKKVYVVFTEQCYEGNTLAGIFDTEALAEAYAEELRAGQRLRFTEKGWIYGDSVSVCPITINDRLEKGYYLQNNAKKEIC